ncbi:MAG: prepilin-type N-terminal cleavage/methylation domain-containing protein [Calditerrivibrio sp.]|nr:prepilin-type N-terminal cleavage/methylation domain-containing protein [Calditerrivibrio sp.]MCA1980700.1 prepilin-type N-terminal cleavage/methylation domain-containing protein [Calditerrivibrio sp.]
MKINEKSFTLIELVIIILLVGILAVAVGPKMSINSFKSESELNSLIANIRYAQHKSIVSGGSWKLEINSNSYTVKDDTGNNANLPGGENPVNVSYNITSNYAEFYFDYLGRPDSDNDSKNNNLINQNIIISFDSYSIKINPVGGIE